MQNQVSELALCKEGGGTHGWIFLGIVEPVGLTLAQLSVWSDQIHYMVMSFSRYLLIISYVSRLVLVLKILASESNKETNHSIVYALIEAHARDFGITEA